MIDSKMVEFNDVNVIFEKHNKKSVKHGDTTFYKLFIDYEWCCDVGRFDLAIQTVALKTGANEDEVLEELEELRWKKTK